MHNYSELIDIPNARKYCKDLSIKNKKRGKYYQKYLVDVQKKIFPLVNDEMISKVPQWSKLLIINEGHVCTHSLNVLYLTMNDVEYLKLPENEQNILKWAALLHDIAKLGPPIFEGRDHIHPFRGGKVVLEIFYHHRILIVDTPEKRKAYD